MLLSHLRFRSKDQWRQPEGTQGSVMLVIKRQDRPIIPPRSSGQLQTEHDDTGPTRLSLSLYANNITFSLLPHLTLLLLSHSAFFFQNPYTDSTDLNSAPSENLSSKKDLGKHFLPLNRSFFVFTKILYLFFVSEFKLQVEKRTGFWFEIWGSWSSYVTLLCWI